MKIKIIVEKTRTGYSAYAEKYPVYTTGGNVSELRENAYEAVSFYFSDMKHKPALSPKDLQYSFSIPSLFELFPINARHFSDQIGMNYTLLSQYIQGRKKPSEKQIARIIDGLQSVGKELSSVTLL